MPGSREGFYSQTGKTVNTIIPEIFLECDCVARKKPIRREKAKPQARPVCGFVASSRVVIFALIGHNTIHIPETFQVFTVLPVAL